MHFIFTALLLSSISYFIPSLASSIHVPFWFLLVPFLVSSFFSPRFSLYRFEINGNCEGSEKNSKHWVENEQGTGTLCVTQLNLRLFIDYKLFSERSDQFIFISPFQVLFCGSISSPSFFFFNYSQTLVPFLEVFPSNFPCFPVFSLYKFCQGFEKKLGETRGET